MAINVGLDFGTHQTKICVEDSSDANNKQYTIFTFKNLDGEEEICLPSKIQINKDLTISYGFYNPDDCYVVVPEPTVIEPEYEQLPVLLLPKEPQNPFDINKEMSVAKKQSAQKDWKDDLMDLRKKLCDEKDVAVAKNKMHSREQYQKRYAEWEEKCAALKIKHLRLIEECNHRNNQLRSEYEKLLAEQTRPQRWEFLYFKQAVFTYNNQPFYIDPKMLTIWYLAYVIFLLEKKYGNTFSIQIGVPSDYDTHRRLRDLAADILVKAYKLVENVFHNDFERFLNTKYTEMIDLTPTEFYTNKEKFEYGINVFPEACAALEAIADSGTVKEGRFHLMVDIGGGTTDIAFFNLPAKKELRVFGFTSVNKGLNYIKENCQLTGGKYSYKKLEDVYWKEINLVIKKLWDKLNVSFDKTGFSRQKLLDAAKNNVCLFSGGGSTFVAVKGVFPFNDDRRMDESILPLRNIIITQHKNIHPIIANAFGLSHARKSDDLNKLEMFDVIFSHLSKNKNDYYLKQDDYSLLDHR